MLDLKQYIQEVEAYGKFQGRKELIAYYNGEKLGKWQMIRAKCFDCMGGYPDGAVDCQVYRCPIYPAMPYKGRELTQTQLEKIKA
jgi:hypothetical protein